MRVSPALLAAPLAAGLMLSGCGGTGTDQADLERRLAAAEGRAARAERELAKAKRLLDRQGQSEAAFAEDEPMAPEDGNGDEAMQDPSEPPLADVVEEARAESDF